MFDYLRQHKVRIKVVRIFNTYGPRMHPFDGRVVSNFIRQALAGEDITLYGDGSQTRCFCYVADMIEGLVRMMESSDDFTGPVNLGNQDEFTVLELARKVVEISGTKSNVVVGRPLPADDPTRRQPDISLARASLGWEPKVPLAEGLRRTIEWFRSIRLSDYQPPTPNY
jgi:UDP-glucuronate decarboxylase